MQVENESLLSDAATAIEPKYTDAIKSEVLARLKLARWIFEKSDKEFVPPEVVHEIESGSFNIRKACESACMYLLLTCFDRLGQNDEFVELPIWLMGSKYKKERRLCEVEGNIDRSLKNMLAAYHEKYGAKQSFRRGISNLKPSNFKLLWDSFDVEYHNGWTDGVSVSTVENPKVLEDLELKNQLKYNFIFKLRNRFTHTLARDFNFSMTSMSPNLNRVVDGEHTNLATAAFHKIWMPATSEMNRWSQWNSSYWTKDHGFEYQGMTYAGEPFNMSSNDWPYLLFHILHDEIDSDFSVEELDVEFDISIYREIDVVGHNNLHMSKLREFLEFYGFKIRDWKS